MMDHLLQLSICTNPCRWKGLERREKARFEAMARRSRGALL